MPSVKISMLAPRRGPLAAALLLLGFILHPAFALSPEGEAGAAASATPALLSAEELEQLVSRIALYPDDLIAITLPASTYPLDVVKAARFLAGGAKGKEPDPGWHETVRALLNYPEIMNLMNDDLDWTWALGEAVIAQQQGVIDAIQQFRLRAYTAGNLETDDKQIVIVEKEVIQIVTADPEVIYIPRYDPATVVIQQPAPVYSYYPTQYPVYYYPYPPGYAFASGLFFGMATAWAFNWHDDYIHHHDYGDHFDDYGELSGKWANARSDIAQGRQDTRQEITEGRQDIRGDRAEGRQEVREGRQDARPSERWQASREGGSSRPGQRPSAGERPRAQPSVSQRDISQRLGAQGARPGDAAARQRDVGKRSAQSGAFGGYERGQSAQRSSKQGSRSWNGGQQRTRSSTSSRSGSRGGSFSGYSSQSRASANSSRGTRSRSSSSQMRSRSGGSAHRSGGGSRGGGARGGGSRGGGARRR